MVTRIRKFVLLGIPLLLISLLLYPYLLPTYCSLVLGVAGMLLELSHPPIRLEVLADGAWRVSVPVLKGRMTFFMNRQRFAREVVFLGLAILPALILATPVGMASRVRLLVVALVLLFVAHTLALTVVIAALARHCDGQAVGRTCEVIAVSLIPWSQITPFGLWGLVTWRYWFPASRRPAADGASQGAR